MFRNYLKTAFRNFTRNKLFTAINIIGLTVGFTACLLIGIFILSEFSYDNFQKNGNRIARVTMEYRMSGTVDSTAVTGTKPGPQFARIFPEIKAYTRTSLEHRILKIQDKLFDEPRFLYADPPFFEMFSFSIIKGDKDKPLNAPNSVVITESMAKKYFGNEDPIGRVIHSGKNDLTVTAVCKDVPSNSQIQFDFVSPFLSKGSFVQNETWFNANWITYLLLQNKNDFTPLQNKIDGYMQTAEVRKEANVEGNDYLKFHIQPFNDVHLYSKLTGFEPNGSMSFIYMLSVIALLILVIAFANYTNLTISQSATRSGEIGVRRVMGASGKQIFFQFINESGFITFISMILAFFTAALLIPWFNQLTGKELSIQSLFTVKIVTYATSLAIIFSLIAGLYPALILSGKKPVSVLKKGFTFTGGNPVLRKGLIIAQFAISVFLIIYTVIILQQMNYLNTRNLGYDRDNVLSMPIGQSMRKNLDLLEDAFRQVPGVQSITTAYETPEDIQWGDGVTMTDSKGQHSVSVNAQPVGLNYLSTLKMKLVAGRSFLKSDFGIMDTSDNYKNFQQPYIINEALASKLGLTPENAIGKILTKGAPGPLVGVVKDFNFQSLHQPIGPLLMFLNKEQALVFLMRINSKNTQQTLADLEKTWKERVPDRPFTFNFLDNDYKQLYQSESRSSSFLTIAASLGIFLACLGLFGLAAFTISKRKKEISIRKVLGANTGSIVLTLSKGFIQLVIAAVIIAFPIAWIFGNKWLTGFAYRIDISLWIFVLVAIITILIAFATTSIQAIQASRANPAETLKNE